MTSQRQQAAQKALWGRQEPLTAPGRPAAATNDRDLIEAIIRHAQDPGYVLIGPAERVFSRDPARKAAVEQVPRRQQLRDGVLFVAGHLRIGSTHHVTYAGHDGPASSVLVPHATRHLADRWARLRPPPGPSTATRP
jgi:hypothetical protein